MRKISLFLAIAVLTQPAGAQTETSGVRSTFIQKHKDCMIRFGKSLLEKGKVDSAAEAVRVAKPFCGSQKFSVEKIEYHWFHDAEASAVSTLSNDFPKKP